jgi:hypothetical protein
MPGQTFCCILALFFSISENKENEIMADHNTLLTVRLGFGYPSGILAVSFRLASLSDNKASTLPEAGNVF